MLGRKAEEATDRHNLCSPHNILKVTKIDEAEMGATCSINGVNKNAKKKIWWEILWEGTNWETYANL